MSSTKEEIFLERCNSNSRLELPVRPEKAKTANTHQYSMSIVDHCAARLEIAG